MSSKHCLIFDIVYENIFCRPIIAYGIIDLRRQMEAQRNSKNIFYLIYASEWC